MKKHVFLKSSVCTLLCILLLFCFSLTAFADVIWEPMDDFYSSHPDECEYEGRTYIANGEKGYIEIFESPDSNNVIDSIENGNMFYVSFIYSSKAGDMGVVEYAVEDGKVTASYGHNEKVKSGWIYMSKLAVKYDNTSFMQDYGEKVENFEGNTAEYIKAGTEVYFYSYPNSGEVETSLETDESFSVSAVYTDQNGRIWGYVNYYYGIKNCWVCLSEPENGETPEIEQDKTELIPPSAPAEASEGISATVLIVIIVAAVVIITVVLLLIFWKKKK